MNTGCLITRNVGLTNRLPESLKIKWPYLSGIQLAASEHHFFDRKRFGV